MIVANVAKGEGQPGHLLVLAGEVLIGGIGRAEDDFEYLSFSVDQFIDFGQDGSEKFTGIVLSFTEVHSEDLGISEGFYWVDRAALA